MASSDPSLYDSLLSTGVEDYFDSTDHWTMLGWPVPRWVYLVISDCHPSEGPLKIEPIYRQSICSIFSVLPSLG
jgi:hypothetical protein